jgi:hypothetical protein
MQLGRSGQPRYSTSAFDHVKRGRPSPPGNCFFAPKFLAPMSALGHKRKWCHARVMSVLSLKADIRQRGLGVRYVQQAD